MSKWNKYYNKTYRKVFCLIFAVLFLISTFIIFNKMQNSKDYFMQRNRNFLADIATEIEGTVDVAQSVSRSVLRDELLIEYFKGKEKNYIYILQLSNKMLKNWYPIFSKNNFNIGVCRPEHNVVIRPGSVSNIDDFWKEINISEKEGEKIDSYFEDDTKILKNGMSFFTEDVVEESHFIILKKDATNKGLLCAIDINLDKIIKIKSDNAGFIIRSNDAVYNGAEFIEKDLDINELEKYKLLEENTYQTDEAIIFVNFQENSERKYVYAIDKAMLQKEYYDVFVQFLLLLGICFVLSLIITFFAIKYLYTPIKMLYNLFSYKDFDEEAFNNLEISIIEKRKIDKMLFLKGVLLGNLNDDISSQLLRHSLQWLNSDIEFVMFEIVNYHEMQSKYELYEINDRVEAAMDIISNFSTDICFEIVNMDLGKFVYLGKRTNSGLIENLNTILYKISEGTQLKVVAVADDISDVAQIATAYTSAYMLIETSEFVSNRQIFRLSEMKKDKMQLYYYPLDYEKMIVQHISNGERQRAIALVDDLLCENLLRRNLEGEALTRFCYAIIATIGRILQVIKKNEQDIFGEGDTIYLKMKMCSTKDEMCQKIIKIFSMLADSVISQNTCNDMEFAEKLKGYIAENYNKDISLLDMSKEFGLSSNYICSLFKNFVSMNFKDYLNMYRINVAKTKMKNPDAKIADIAQSVGFNSANTFIRCFKRYEGITPKRFMELLSED